MRRRVVYSKGLSEVKNHGLSVPGEVYNLLHNLPLLSSSTALSYSRKLVAVIFLEMSQQVRATPGQYWGHGARCVFGEGAGV